MRRRLSLATTLVSILATLGLPARAGGRIVVATDDWTLSDTGIVQAPPAADFARNVASWFTGGGAGQFLVYSDNFGLTGASLDQVMTAAGHTWQVSTGVAFDLPTLSQYDAVFIGGYAADTVVLRDYVNSGGNVYIFGGSGVLDEAATFNPFLTGFGLSFSSTYDAINSVVPIASGHSLFANVTGLYQKNGSSITDLDSSSTAQLVLVTDGPAGAGLYAIYDGTEPNVYCTTKTSSAGCVTTIATSSQGSPVSGSNDYSVDATMVQGQKNGLVFGGNMGGANLPFSGGILCVQPPLRRGPIRFSGGSNGLSCDGDFSTIINDGTLFPSGLDAGPGNTAWYQYWYRDPNNGAGNLGTALSNGIQLAFL